MMRFYSGKMAAKRGVGKIPYLRELFSRCSTSRNRTGTDFSGTANRTIRLGRESNFRIPPSLTSAVRTAWPATRPVHSFLKFRTYPLDVLPSGFRFLDRDNPA